jgi:hypothetical protein
MLDERQKGAVFLELEKLCDGMILDDVQFCTRKYKIYEEKSCEIENLFEKNEKHNYRDSDYEDGNEIDKEYDSEEDKEEYNKIDEDDDDLDVNELRSEKIGNIEDSEGGDKGNYKYVRQLIQEKKIILKYVSTKQMMADALTKPMGINIFRNFKEFIGIVKIQELLNQEGAKEHVGKPYNSSILESNSSSLKNK